MVITTQDLTIGYGGNAVVRQVSLSIAEGEIVGLLGISGSGKSTLARALLGKLPPGARILSGTVQCAGHAALIPQEPSLALNPFLRAGEQIAHCARHRPFDPRSVPELLVQLGLPEPERICRSYPHQLSGGQQQRVAWAQALIQRPALLIADEPTTALDTILQRELTDLVLALARREGCAVLWISHDSHLLAAICNRLLVMQAGELIEQGDPRQVLQNPRHAHTAALCEAAR